jgi:hypothetical protein
MTPQMPRLTNAFRIDCMAAFLCDGNFAITVIPAMAQSLMLASHAGAENGNLATKSGGAV